MGKLRKEKLNSFHFCSIGSRIALKREKCKLVSFFSDFFATGIFTLILQLSIDLNKFFPFL
jgi:hypothetical protein